jgi:hypothetical protein
MSNREYLEERGAAMRQRGEMCPEPIHQAGECLCVRESRHDGEHLCKHGCDKPNVKERR